MERSLARAIAADELDVAVQAVVGADDAAVIGVEALVRWPQEDGTVRAPSDFVTIAERSNLVVDLDRWVIGEMVAHAGALEGRPPHGVADGVGEPLGPPRLGDLVRRPHPRDARRSTGSSRAAWSSSSTESALIANLDHVVDELRRLREHGVSVAVDDFGTGYTSLALLHQLPIDTLKLDRVLTANLGQERVRAVVQLVVDTAHLIGLSVTAEGVETAEQMDELRELGVDALQGFLLHRPSPVDAFVDGLDGLRGPGPGRRRHGPSRPAADGSGRWRGPARLQHEDADLAVVHPWCGTWRSRRTRPPTRPTPRPAPRRWRVGRRPRSVRPAVGDRRPWVGFEVEHPGRRVGAAEVGAEQGQVVAHRHRDQRGGAGLPAAAPGGGHHDDRAARPAAAGADQRPWVVRSSSRSTGGSSRAKDQAPGFDEPSACIERWNGFARRWR